MITAKIPYTVDTGEKLVNETVGPNTIRRRRSGKNETDKEICADHDRTWTQRECQVARCDHARASGVSSVYRHVAAKSETSPVLRNPRSRGASAP